MIFFNFPDNKTTEVRKGKTYTIELSALNLVACDTPRRLSPAGFSRDICRRAAAPRPSLLTRPLLATTKIIHPVPHLTRGF
jgi:hypothetical protein